MSDVDPRRAAASFDRACTLQFSRGSDNALALARGGMFRHDEPTTADYPVILRGSKAAIDERAPAKLSARACTSGWPAACGPH